MADSQCDARSPISRRLFLFGVSTLSLSLAGCRQLIQPASTPATAADAGAFPVTVRHAYGSTLIAKEPLRIATLGPASNDVCLALGVVPLAMPLSDSQPNGSTPWFDALWRKFGVNMPLLLDESNGRTLEELRGMGPDLILAAGGGLTRTRYNELSAIAPVIAPSADPDSAGWRASLTLIGDALGRQNKAREVLRETEAAITEELGNYPDLDGTSFAAIGVRSAIGSHFNVMASGSNPVRMLEEWGLNLAPSIDSLSRERSPEQQPTFPVPPDRASELDSDIAVVLVQYPELNDLQPAIVESLPAYGRGAGLLVDSRDAAAALETGSCLSAQWLSRTLLPKVAKLAYYARERVPSS